MYCVKCGKNIGGAEEVCSKCGSTEFSNERRGAKFSAAAIIWMLVSFVINAGLGVLYFCMGMIGNNPNINFILKPPFLRFNISRTGEVNIALLLIGVILVVYSLVYIVLIAKKKQYLYGVLMVSAISIASFMFFFYGGSPLSIIMFPILVLFPSVTRGFIGDEWEYMG